MPRSEAYERKDNGRKTVGIKLREEFDTLASLRPERKAECIHDQAQ
jgi:hypothetical protein